ncbi:MAG TPA: FmdB family zinc ribbon protein [Pyrinomonadaceae bacterium]
MPIYEYQCKKCNAHTEVMQKITDKPMTKCRKCGGRLEKLLSAPAIQFKGSGWYVTDYAGKKSEDKKESKEEKNTSSETKAASEKATSTEKDSSKKASKPKPATSSGD